MANRDFDSEIDRTEKEPVWFKLMGKRWDCTEDVNGKRLLDNVAMLDGDSVADQRDGVLAIFGDCIEESQQDEFFELLDDPKTIVPMGKLVEISGWLAEQFADRPTKQREQSQTGRANGGRTSTAKRTAKASTSRASARQRT